MKNWAWYLTLEAAKRQVQIDDSLDDETYSRVIRAASDVMPRQFFVQTATHYFTATNPNELRLKGLDLLSVTQLATDDGHRTYSTVWSSEDYDLGPDEAPYLSPPQPYWKVSTSRPYLGYGYTSGSSYGGYPVFLGVGGGQRFFPPRLRRGVRILGRWGAYDVRHQLSVTLVAPDVDSEIQVLTPSGTVSGGSFTLRFATDETSPILWSADAAAIQAALEALPSIGAGSIAATGGPIATNPVTLTFQGALANEDVSQIIVDDMDLTGAGANLVASTVHQGSDTSLVDDTTSTINVSAAGEVETGHTLHIDDEDIFVQQVDSSVLKVERGMNGTTPATHADGAPIEIYTYPVVDQACMLLVQRYVRRSKDAPFGLVGSIDGFMRLAINDPDVLGLLGKYILPAVA